MIRLSPREKQVAELIHAGKTDKQIGAALGISEDYAGACVRKAFKKLGAHSRVEAALMIERERIGSVRPIPPHVQEQIDELEFIRKYLMQRVRDLEREVARLSPSASSVEVLSP